MGNWSLTCLKEGEIAIHNSDGQQATILKEDLPGFVFESNRGTKHSFTAETSLGKFVGMCDEKIRADMYCIWTVWLTRDILTSGCFLLGSEFVTGWTGKRGRKLKSKLEKTKQKVSMLLFRELTFLSFDCCACSVQSVSLKINGILLILY